MLIVRFAIPAWWRARWKSAIADAVIAGSGTSTKCFLTRLSRSSSSSIVRDEQRIRFATRYDSIASDGRFGPCSLAVTNRWPAVLDQVTFSLLRQLQVRRSETLAIPLPGDGEIGPVLATAFPDTHSRNSPAFDAPSDAETNCVSTAHARMNASRSARK
jgi:hypothetical protein